tara:strand:+ start:973 stop:1893 length:921 start_codon:yes stop_codon:yes gene_type:complete
MMEDYPKVQLHSLPEDNNMVSGKYQPQRIRNETVDSVNLVIRSEDRTYGDDFNFSIDLLTSSNNIRKIQMAKCMLPLLPQINVHNKTVSVVHVDGNITFDLEEGYYSVQAMVNMMQSAFTDAWINLDPSNLVTINYDIDRRSIIITDDNGENFFITNDCNFNRYARNVVKFNTRPATDTPTTSVQESSSLGMIYSRYVIATSFRLTEDQRSFSMVSNTGSKNIIGVLDLASAYSASQFAVSTSFAGTDVVLDCLDYAPKINLVNRNKSLKVIDIQIEDEFGFNLGTLNTPNYQFVYPVSMWFQCYL